VGGKLRVWESGSVEKVKVLGIGGC